MAKIIIGIHGLANKPRPEILEKYWEDSIREGLERNEGVRDADFRFVSVYWAALLYKNPLHEDPAFDFDPMYNDEPYRPAGKLERYDDGWLDVARAALGQTVGGTIDGLRKYVGLDTVADFVLARKIRDLHFYYDEGRTLVDRAGRRRTARRVLVDEVQTALRPLAGDDVLLIAHSMGSIIAYDALRDIGRATPDFELGRFVTIGSPLGLPTVKAHVHDERQYADDPVRTPTVVTRSWVNFADRRDPVAADSHLADDYQPNGRDVQVRDDLVMNDYSSSSHHKSYGYLRTPEMSEHIKAYLGS